MPQPLISILTPFKNTSEFLPECLDSILAQTYANWELLIVDDHSTDDSYQIVDKYAKNDSRIKILDNPGHGIIDALKCAFAKSQGSYVTRMDSDDVMTTDKLEVLLNSLLEKGRSHLAVGLVRYFSEIGINNGYERYEFWLNGLTSKGINYSEIYKECVVPSPCWMIHKNDLELCDAFNPNRYPEDYDLAFRFYEHGMVCIPCDKTLHHWRDYPTRTSRTDANYAQNNFLELKMSYFLELHHEAKRTLTIWGAGFKGKELAKFLKEKHIPFIWVCNNPKKIGKHIYDVELHSYHHLSQLNNPQCIITVANEASQQHIKNYCESLQMKTMQDYFFFC